MVVARERRLALLRRVLEGQAVVYAVQVFHLLGGDAKDFHSHAERQMCDDLRALGYQGRVRPHSNSMLRTYFIHDCPLFGQTLPRPLLEEEADCEGPRQPQSEIMAGVKRHLDEVFGKGAI